MTGPPAAAAAVGASTGTPAAISERSVGTGGPVDLAQRRGDRSGGLDLQADGPVAGSRRPSTRVEVETGRRARRHPDRRRALGREGRVAGDDDLRRVTGPRRLPGLATVRRRVPCTAGEAEQHVAWWPARPAAASQSLVTSPAPSWSYAVEHRGAEPATRRPHAQGQVAAPRHELARSSRDVRRPGDRDPAQPGTSTPAGAREHGDVGDRRSGVGVDQLEDRGVLGGRADPGEPLVRARRGARQRRERGGDRPGRDQAGGQVAGRGDDRRRACGAGPGHRPGWTARSVTEDPAVAVTAPSEPAAARDATPTAVSPPRRPRRAPGSRRARADERGRRRGHVRSGRGRRPRPVGSHQQRRADRDHRRHHAEHHAEGDPPAGDRSPAVRCCGVPGRRGPPGRCSRAPPPGRRAGRRRAPARRGRPGPAARAAVVRTGVRRPSHRAVVERRGRPARPGCAGPRRWPGPARAVASSAAATSPSAGAGSTTYSIPWRPAVDHAGRRPGGEGLHVSGEGGVLAG